MSVFAPGACDHGQWQFNTDEERIKCITIHQNTRKDDEYASAFARDINKGCTDEEVMIDHGGWWRQVCHIDAILSLIGMKLEYI